MAYNTFYPATYQPMGYNPYYQQMMAQQQAQSQQQSQQAQNTPQIQQSGFILVRSEEEAKAYPVAPGNSVTFKDETRPYCYVKTMGFSQFDRPTFERYRLVKEDEPETMQSAPKNDENSKGGEHIDYVTKHDLDGIWDEIEALKAKMSKKSRKIIGEDDENDAE